MIRFSFTTGALAISALAIFVSASHADSYYGPRQVGNQCWKPQGGNSLGYWETCKDASTSGATANASIARPVAKKSAKQK
jgi:hypothetical protein